MTTKIGIVLLGLMLCLGCNRSTPDPRIAQLEAEIKKLKAGDKTIDATKKAIRELKKMNSVVEMGISYPDYTKTLLDAKPAFDEAISDMPEGKLKTSLSLAMKAYVDAGTFWNISIQMSDGYYVYVPNEQQSQFTDYNLDWKYDKTLKSIGLQKIWAFATVNLAAADELIKQETAKP